MFKKSFMLFIFSVMFATQALAGQICADVGKYHGSPPNGIWTYVGQFNSFGIGTGGWTGNRFTQEAFDYDVCRATKPASQCTALGTLASNAWYSAYDCQNMQSPWDTNWAVTIFIYQQQRQTSLWATVDTNLFG